MKWTSLWISKMSFIPAAAIVFSSLNAQTAIPPASNSMSVQKAQAAYQLNMKVGMKNSSPVALNFAAKTNVKSSYSQFSDDGKVETLVEVLPKPYVIAKKNGLIMDVVVQKKVMGELKQSNKFQMFVPANKEAEVNLPGKDGALNLAVAASPTKSL